MVNYGFRWFEHDKNGGSFQMNVMNILIGIEEIGPERERRREKQGGWRGGVKEKRMKGEGRGCRAFCFFSDATERGVPLKR